MAKRGISALTTILGGGLVAFGHPDHEHGAEVATLFDVNRALVRLDRQLAEVEAQAAVCACGSAALLDLVVATKDRVTVGDRYGRTAVTDRDLDAVLVARRADRAAPTARRIARR